MTAYGKDARVSYSAYLKVPELLALQQPLAEPPAHDELQFIVVHQVYELWFRLVLHELDAVKAALDEAAASGVPARAAPGVPARAAPGVLAPADAASASGEVPLRTATRLLKRVEAILKVLVLQIHVLESMRPVDFLRFRAQLNPASGFQSAQFREVECLMGLKDAELIRRVDADPRIGALRARFEGDSIPDAVYRLLRARGLPVTPPAAQRSAEQERATLHALRGVYEAPDAHAALHDLCEALVDVDEQLVLWRRHHIMMVERQIGAKPGTGKDITGDLDGIRYLLTSLSRQALPDLWAVRTVLEAPQ